LSHKIIIFKTFYYRGENNSSIYMNTENKETEKPQLTEDELQGIYLYLSMYYEQMTQEEKNTWIILMNELDPEFSNIEDEE
jgi:hypothetical protein